MFQLARKYCENEGIKKGRIKFFNGTLADLGKDKQLGIIQEREIKVADHSQR